MSINIDAVLNNVAKYNQNKLGDKNNYAKANLNTQITSETWQKATQMVADYRAKQEANKQTEKQSSSSTNLFGMSFSQIANMSTKDFLNYAYENKADSGYDSESKDSSNIKLPMLVRYKTSVFSTTGKSFMAVVAKIKAKFPNRSEEEIAAELMTKYGGNNSNVTADGKKSASGNNLNFSA